MAPWDRLLRQRRLARIQALPTRLASAQPIEGAPNILLRGASTRQPWQEQSRGYARSLGVVRFAGGLTSSVVSRCPMVAERLVDPVNNRWAPDPDPVANGVLRGYRNARETTEELIRRHTWHRFFVGECLSSVEQGATGVEWFIWATAAAEIYPERPVLLRELPGGTVFNGGAREVPPNQVRRFWQADEDYCADTETEILSQRGWLRHNEVVIGDEVLTLNHDTGASEWHTVQAVNRFQVVGKPMLAMESDVHSSLTTLAHRWPIIDRNGMRSWRTSDTLVAHHRLVGAAAYADCPTEPKWSDAFVELVAWFWTEGHIRRDSGSITLSQSERVNPHYAASIRAALTTMFGPTSGERMWSGWRPPRLCSFQDCGWLSTRSGLCHAHDQQRRTGRTLRPVRRRSPKPPVPERPSPMWREQRKPGGVIEFCLNAAASEQIRDAAPNRVISLPFLLSLTASQIRMFVERSIDADGTRHGNSMTLAQADYARAEAFGIACTLAGFAPRIHDRGDAGVTVSVGVHRGIRPDVTRMRTQTTYSGIVWCPTTANGTWYARRRGSCYFTGNSLLATSPMVGIIDDCERYVLLGRRTKREAKSALGLNGVWFTPERAHKYPTGPDGKPALYSILDQDMTAIAAKGWDDDDGIASMAPFSIHYDTDEKTPAPQWIDVGKALDPKGLDARREALECIVRGLPIPNIIGIEGTPAAEANHWCADTDTEILTRDGWKRHDALEVGDQVLTLNHKTDLSEWQPCDAVNRFDVVNEPMLSMQGRFHSSLTTMNHRWAVRRKQPGGLAADRARAFVTSAELNTSDFIPTAAPCADLPVEAKYDDAFVELVAWFYTEGTCGYRVGRDLPQVTIHQSHAANTQNVARIRRALTATFGAASVDMGRGGRHANYETAAMWREIRRPDKPGMTDFKLNGAAGRIFTDLAPHRVVPLAFIHALTLAQLELFISVSIAADGYRQAHGHGGLIQKDPAMLAAFELAVILVGRTPITTTAEYDGYQRHIMIRCAQRATSVVGPRGRQWTRETYTGVVWCPTTANRTWLARRDGKVFFTGNSGWMIAEDFFKTTIAPFADPIFHSDLTDGMFRPSLRQLAATGAWQGNPEEWRAGYDPTPVIIHPDKAGRAVELYKVGAISRDAVLLETGFDTTDAPNADELAQFIEIQRALRTPTQSLPALAPDAGTTLEAPPQQPVAALAAASALAPYPVEVDGWLDD